MRLGREDVADSFINNTKGVEPNEFLTVLDEYHRTPLHLACMFGHPQLVFLLLSLAEQCHMLEDVLNARDVAQRMTPLMEACKRPGLFSIVQQLSQAGANWYLRNCDGMSAMDFATMAKDENLHHISDLFANAMKVPITHWSSLRISLFLWHLGPLEGISWDEPTPHSIISLHPIPPTVIYLPHLLPHSVPLGPGKAPVNRQRRRRQPPQLRGDRRRRALAAGDRHDPHPRPAIRRRHRLA